jgi:hypothetical protein
MLKTLVTALAAAGALAVATPAVLACPGMEKEKTAGEQAEEAPKTADKAKAKQKDEKQKDSSKKKDADKAGETVSKG